MGKSQAIAKKAKKQPFLAVAGNSPLKNRTGLIESDFQAEKDKHPAHSATERQV